MPDRVRQPVKRDDDVQPAGHDSHQRAAIVEVVEVTGSDDDGASRRDVLYPLDAQLDTAQQQATDRANRDPGQLMGQRLGEARHSRSPSGAGGRDQRACRAKLAGTRPARTASTTAAQRPALRLSTIAKTRFAA